METIISITILIDNLNEILEKIVGNNLITSDFYNAIENNDLVTLKTLLKQKNKSNFNDAELVTYLVSAEAENSLFTNTKLKAGEIVVMLTTFDKLNLIKYLVELGAQYNTFALNNAIRLNYLNVVQYLVSTGIQLNKKSLKVAINTDNLEMVKYLISIGAEVREKDLQYAIENNNLQIIEYLDI